MYWRKNENILTFVVLLMVLTACTTIQAQTPEPAATEAPQAGMPNPASVLLRARMATHSRFILLPMAAKPEYVYFRMAVNVTSGLISGESAAWPHKKA